MRDILGPPRESCFLTEEDIHAWWYFLQGFVHTETATDGTIGAPFTARASYMLKHNTFVGGTYDQAE